MFLDVNKGIDKMLTKKVYASKLSEEFHKTAAYHRTDSMVIVNKGI